MLKYQIQIDRTGWPAEVAESGTRAGKKIVKASLTEMGVYWHTEQLPDHFKDSATRRYGYQKRTGKYNAKKYREKGHNRPLEYSGDLKRGALRRAEIRQAGKRVRVTFGGGNIRAINFGGKATKSGATYPNLRHELTATTTPEVKRLSRIGRRFAEKELAKSTKRTRKKIK